jgi:hypothetical protein
MSREFGDFSGGYFHNKIDSAASDCQEGRCKLTQMWGEFLMIFSDVSYEISNYEASDSGLYAPIMESIAKIPAMKKKLSEIDDYLDDYKRVAEEALREYCQKKDEK